MYEFFYFTFEVADNKATGCCWAKTPFENVSQVNIE